MKTLQTIALALVTGLALATAMSATTVELASLGTASVPGETSSLGNTIQIVSNSSWSPALGSSSWISYANTGRPGSIGYVQVSNGTVVSFLDDFHLAGLPTSAWIEVMADDSTSVKLNGVTLVAEAPTTNNHFHTCSDFGIGCRGAYMINLPPNLLKVGNNVLEFDVAQRGGSSFGLDYFGQIIFPTPTPEPAALSLLAAGLLGICISRVPLS